MTEKIGLKQFVQLITEANEAGNKATLEHKEKYKYHTSKKKQEKNNYHPPGTDLNCEDCKKIIEQYDKIIELQTKHIGMTGIPVDSLLSAIKITKATIEMLEVDKNE